MTKAVVLIGSPLSGYTVIGPFETFDDAEEYADNVEDSDAWAMELIEPIQ